MVRQPMWAGSFYEADPEALRNRLINCFKSKLGPGSLPNPEPKKKGTVLGVVSPHAGYIYSGAGAANSVFALAGDGMPSTIVILGPKHRPFGAEVAIDSCDAWLTPLGSVSIDKETASEIASASSLLELDYEAHIYEHSLEVQVPFLQFAFGNGIKIVPIAVGLSPYAYIEEAVAEIGQAIAGAISGKSAAIVASTDFTHQEPLISAEKKDAQAIAAIEKLDAPLLLETVRNLRITMCGAAPTAIAIEACKQLGASKAELLSYFTSAEETGDRSSVVGYGALKIMKG